MNEQTNRQTHIRANNEVESREGIVKINKTKFWCFGEINEIHIPLAIWLRKKMERRS